MWTIFSLVVVCAMVSSVWGWGFKKPEGPLEPVVTTRMPHEYLKVTDVPSRWDWRNVNGTNYVAKVMTQQNPAVCGSCWAEAATGKFSNVVHLGRLFAIRATFNT